MTWVRTRGWGGPELFRAYLAVGLCVFFSSFVVGVSSKFSNNLFYVLIGTPVLIFMIRDPAQTLRLMWPYKWMALFLGLTVMSELVAVDGNAIRAFKYSLYLLVFACSLAYVAQGNQYPEKILLGFCSVGLVVGLLAYLDWTVQAHSYGEMPRAVFNNVNPTRTALLLLTTLIGLWLFVVEPYLDKRCPAWVHGTGLTVFVILAVGVFVMFQSRSTLLSLVLFLLVYSLFRGNGFRLGAAIIISALVLWATGWYETVLVRGTSYRTEIWSDAIRYYVEHCGVLFGCGTGSDRMFAGEFKNPHSGYLAIVYYYGLFPSIAFGVMAASAFLRAYKLSDRWFLLAMPGWGGAVASSSGFINSPGPYWVYFWMPVILSIACASRQVSDRVADRPMHQGQGSLPPA